MGSPGAAGVGVYPLGVRGQDRLPIGQRSGIGQGSQGIRQAMTQSTSHKASPFLLGVNGKGSIQADGKHRQIAQDKPLSQNC